MAAYRLMDSRHISTHTLRKEGDGVVSVSASADAEFQPTPSARRVTFLLSYYIYINQDFNPHPPQGG